MTLFFPEPLLIEEPTFPHPLLQDHPTPGLTKAGQWLKRRRQQDLVRLDSFLTLHENHFEKSGAYLHHLTTPQAPYVLQIFKDLSILVWEKRGTQWASLPYVLELATRIFDDTLRIKWSNTTTGPLLERALNAQTTTVHYLEQAPKAARVNTLLPTPLFCPQAEHGLTAYANALKTHIDDALIALIHHPTYPCALTLNPHTNQTLHPALSYQSSYQGFALKAKQWIIAYCLVNGFDIHVKFSIQGAYRAKRGLQDSLIDLDTIEYVKMQKRIVELVPFYKTLQSDYAKALEENRMGPLYNRFACSAIDQHKVLTSFTFNPTLYSAHDKIHALSLLEKT